ncbi:MAG: hypothetical protein MK135_15535, partial [Polyangiaceae bacterium]|nr:hypothetical protein [Polyangiaceae bacterium]
MERSSGENDKYSKQSGPIPCTNVVVQRPMPKSQLIVASTRLPVTMQRGEEGWSVTDSTGGLVTALAAVREKRKFTWLGWPGAYVARQERR